MKDQYRKKPVIIDAYQLPAAGEDVPDSFHEWCQKVGFDTFESGRDETLIIPTLEGEMTAAPGDWIIKGVKGEFYPCKPDIFAATYEPAEADRKRSKRNLKYRELYIEACQRCENLEAELEADRQRRGEPWKHDLYQTGDSDAPEQIKDGNGEVVLDLCKRCGKAEIELMEPCAVLQPTAPAVKESLTVAEPVKVPSDVELQAAQEVFEKWFCEELGLDIDSKESEAIIRKMLTSALLARYGQPAQPAASAKHVGEAQLFQPAVTNGAFTHCVFDSKVVSEGTKLYSAPVAVQPSVPDGWKLVPVDLTDEMAQAAWNSGAAGYVGEGKYIHDSSMAWDAMLAAAPTPPATKQEK